MGTHQMIARFFSGGNLLTQLGWQWQTLTKFLPTSIFQQTTGKELFLDEMLKRECFSAAVWIFEEAILFAI